MKASAGETAAKISSGASAAAVVVAVVGDVVVTGLVVVVDWTVDVDAAGPLQAASVRTIERAAVPLRKPPPPRVRIRAVPPR